MSGNVKPIPDGFNTLSPYLIVDDPEKAIEFYKKAFGAEEIFKNFGPDGEKIVHAQLKVGTSMLMLTGEYPSWNVLSPKAIGGSGVTIHIYVEDAEKLYSQAVKAGAKPTMPLTDAFWGDRYGQVEDPFGHKWSIATHVKNMTPEEIQKASEEYFATIAKSQE